MSNELIEIEIKNPIAVFKEPNGLDSIIDRIEEEVKSIDGDISTPAGRDTIRSIAYKIAKSKTALDKIGKDLTEAARAEIDAVNKERKRAWERLEKLQADVRKPLTDWENKEKDRVAAHEGVIWQIENYGNIIESHSAEELDARLSALLKINTEPLEEFKDRAEKAKAEAEKALVDRIAALKKAEEERAELERLRRAEEERKQKEREEAAAEAARKEAEEKARKEAEEAERKAREERERIEREKEAERERAEQAEREAKEAEQRRVEAEEKAKKDAAEAEERRKIEIAEAEQRAKEEAQRAAAAAAAAERERIEEEQRKEAEEAAKREKDRKHKAKVNGEALEGVQGCGVTAEQAKVIVTAIAKGEIPHVKITY